MISSFVFLLVKFMSQSFKVTLAYQADPIARVSLTTKPAECPAICPAPFRLKGGLRVGGWEINYRIMARKWLC